MEKRPETPPEEAPEERTEKPPLLRPVDDEMRAMARGLLARARFGALAVLVGEPPRPFVSRIALGSDRAGPLSLVSELAQHTGALRARPECALLVGEPGEKGDPLTHPRLSLQCMAEFVARDAPDFAPLRAAWLESHPKSKLYIDFADFSFVRFRVEAAFLNGGFGLASALTPADLGIEPGAGRA